MATTAVILARGLGTRMRKAATAGDLNVEQSRAADIGLKSMIPDNRGRPFLDHLLTALADVGVARVVMVVAPDHQDISDHYQSSPTRRIRLEWAVQLEPLGTADAVVAAETLLDNMPFLVMNADNLYPVEALRSMVQLGAPGLVGFETEGLLQHSNIDADRLASFALLEVDDHGYLSGVVEKPSVFERSRFTESPLVSMNLWRFDATIFSACRNVPISSRGERELPQAVALAINDGVRFKVIRSRDGVLDLSSRGDIADVAARLAVLPTDP